MLLEIAVFNLPSLSVALQAGADRIELCEAYRLGGVTPCLEMLEAASSIKGIDIFPIVRPRGGDFIYTDAEFTQMKQDVLRIRTLGFRGVVLGLLTPDREIDEDRTQALVKLADPMEVTFHRAFDHAQNPFESMETIIRCGCRRILTSGQASTAFEGRFQLKQLISKASGRIVIMPGGGIRSSLIDQMAEVHANEWHSAALLQPDASIPDAAEIIQIKNKLNHRGLNPGY